MVARDIPVDEIRTEKNVREIEEISDLAKSIQQFGLLQPVVVVHENGGYTLVAGARRLAAMKMLGESTIAAIVNDEIRSHQRQHVKLTENIQRQDMTPMEIVAAIDGIKERNTMFNDAAVCRMLGKSQAWLSEIRKAALAYGDLIQSGVERKTVDHLTKTDLIEIGRQPESNRVKAAAKITGAKPGKGWSRAMHELEKQRGSVKRVSHVDDTGGLTVSQNKLMVRVLCADEDTRRRLMKELTRLKAEWA